MSERSKRIAIKVGIVLLVAFAVWTALFLIQRAISPGVAKAQTIGELCGIRCEPPDKGAEPIPGVEQPTGSGTPIYVPLQCPTGTAPNPDGSYDCLELWSAPSDAGEGRFRRCPAHAIGVGPVKLYDIYLCQRWEWEGNRITEHDKLELYCDPTIAGDALNWNCGQVTARADRWRDDHRGWWESATKEYVHCFTYIVDLICDTYGMRAHMTVWAGGNSNTRFWEEVWADLWPR